MTDTLPLAVLDFVGIEYGESAHDALQGAIGIAQAVEQAGYRRYWVSEHHNMRSLACSAPEVLTAAVAARTESIRVGAAGIMLPNHSAFKVAEVFRTLMALHPGRIDLGLGRAPGTDPLTAHVLRRGIDVDPAAEFPEQVAELLAYLGDGVGFADDHPYGRLVAAPVVDEVPQLFVLGSSGYGTQFAAVNGMSAVFAHHMSPDLAVPALRRVSGAVPAAAGRCPAVLGDLGAVVRQRRPGRGGRVRGGVDADDRQPAPQHPRAAAPRAGREYARSPEFRRGSRDGRMVTGEAKAVVDRLLELRQEAEVDEIVVVTPNLDRARRTASFRAIADAWRAAAD